LYNNERVRINGLMVSDQMLCDSFARVDRARQPENHHAEVSLTYFEFGTLAALDIFCNEKVDIQILEVGLGGRLDAVNIMEPDAAVIVNVALDHEAWLGDNREAIGSEKAGIFRADIPLIIGESDPPASIISAAAALQNDQLYLYGKHFSIETLELGAGVTAGWHFSGLTRQGKRVDWPALPNGALPLPSAACAIQAICSLGLANQKAVAQGLERASLQGRCQQLVWKERHIILDVAHNPAGARYLARWMATWLAKVGQQLTVVFSALGDKDYAGSMAELAPLVHSWYLAPLPVSRAASLEKLLESAAGIRGKAQGFDTIGAALHAALADSRQGDTILVCGSFYTVAEALKTIQSGEK